MKLLVPAIVLLLAAASCKKEDEVAQRKSELPTPTCDVQSDDGKFEIWTSRQIWEIGFDSSEAVSKESLGGLGKFWIPKTSFKSGERIKFYYTQSETIHLKFSIRFPNDEWSSARSGIYTIYDSDNGSGPKRDSATVDIPSSLDRGRGCSRLYYQFLRNWDTVITQGHFDLSFE